MSKELVISANRHETKVALIDDDQLVEVYFQRSNEYSLAGSIHKGRVTRVLPGMQSAFVDLGLERDTFLYVSDFLEDHEDFDKITGDERSPVQRSGGRDRDRGSRRDGGALRQDRPFRAQPAAEGPVAVAAAPSVTETPAETMLGEETPDALATKPADVDEEKPESAEAPSATDANPQTAGTERERQEHERRGRRSRRRRRGSRGFPDSKYANEGGPSGGADAPSKSEPAPNASADHRESPIHREPHRESSSNREFPAHRESTPRPSPSIGASTEPGHVAPVMLPGESLAKYRGTPALTAQSIPTVHEEPADLPQFLSDPESGADDEVDIEFAEPVHYLPENALPDAPVHPHKVLQAQVTSAPSREPLIAKENKQAAENAATESPREVPALIAPSPFPTDEFFAVAPLVHEPEEQEDRPAESAHADVRESLRESSGESLLDAASDLPASYLTDDDDEDHDIQAMILGDVEGIEIAQAEAEGEGSSGSPESGSAAVRERGGRYPHRVSRRRRRGGRGGTSPENGRPEQTHEAQNRSGQEPAPSEVNAVESSSPRPEVRENRGENRGENRAEKHERNVSRPNNAQPLISDLLKEGQEIIVQIAKEPLGQKGARITSHIALPGRYVVYMPTLEHMGVSRKIESDEERLRLKRVLQAKRPGLVGGFITRTAAEGRTEDEIAGDMLFLYNLWQDIKTKADKRPAPMMLHHDLDIVQRILRDQLADNFKAIWIDNEEQYESVLRFVERFQPSLVPKIKLYTREAPIFDAFGVTAELEKALRPKVWLKSGGFIVINQTEALVAIDVNTGKYVGKTNRLEDTIVKTNTEAIKEIVRQIRLRDLGGIIVIDFIDMDERKNRAKVMQVLEEAMRVDRAPYKILQFNDFGLVAITRKRVKQSLERTLCSPCPHCEGAGYVKSVQTVVSEILTEARKMSKAVEGKDVMLRVHPEVAKVLKSQQNKYLEELEEILKRPVLVKSDAMLHHEKFDLA